MRRIVLGLVACTVVVAAVGGIAVMAVVTRGPADPPIAGRVPDFAFLLPGVERLVEWEAERDARRAVRAKQGLLLGYNHGSDVGELGGCTVERYEEGAGRHEDVPAWASKAVTGMMTVGCDGPEEVVRYQFTVLECGNPFDTYQVIYGRAFNEEMLRLSKYAANGETNG